jgi:hypothetical protein
MRPKYRLHHRCELVICHKKPRKCHASAVNDSTYQVRHLAEQHRVSQVRQREWHWFLRHRHRRALLEGLLYTSSSWLSIQQNTIVGPDEVQTGNTIYDIRQACIHDARFQFQRGFTHVCAICRWCRHPANAMLSTVTGYALLVSILTINFRASLVSLSMFRVQDQPRLAFESLQSLHRA